MRPKRVAPRRWEKARAGARRCEARTSDGGGDPHLREPEEGGAAQPAERRADQLVGVGRDARRRVRDQHAEQPGAALGRVLRERGPQQAQHLRRDGGEGEAKGWKGVAKGWSGEGRSRRSTVCDHSGGIGSGAAAPTPSPSAVANPAASAASAVRPWRVGLPWPSSCRPPRRTYLPRRRRDAAEMQVRCR